MDLVLILRIAIASLALWFFVVMLIDCIKHKEDFRGVPIKNWIVYTVTDFYVCVLDTLGIGNMATSMATFRLTKTVKDEHLAATGNTAYTVSTIAEFFFFLSIIQIDAVTLLTMISSAVIGSLVGASIVTKWPPSFFRKVLGVALAVVAIVGGVP